MQHNSKVIYPRENACVKRCLSSVVLILKSTSAQQVRDRPRVVQYSQAMTTLIVDDQLLLCNIARCILGTLAQRAHQFVVHGERAEGAPDTAQMEKLKIAAWRGMHSYPSTRDPKLSSPSFVGWRQTE